MTIRLTIETEPGTPFDSAELQRFLDLAVAMRGVHGIVEAVEQHVLVAELGDGPVTVSDGSVTGIDEPPTVEHLVAILVTENRWVTYAHLRALGGMSADVAGFRKLCRELDRDPRVATKQELNERWYSIKVDL